MIFPIVICIEENTTSNATGARVRDNQSKTVSRGHLLFLPPHLVLREIWLIVSH
jgi:hypothetical protein